jgi:hypothetical protein
MRNTTSAAVFPQYVAMVFAFILNRLGKSIAALIDARLFERIHRMQGRFDALS